MGADTRAELRGDAPSALRPWAASAHSEGDEEAALIDAAVAGDRAAFAALYDRYVDRVYRACYYRTGHRADAEDLTQQTFLQAWQAIGRYRRGAAPFVGWLLTISQRLAINHYRRRREFIMLDTTLDTTLTSPDPAAAVAADWERDVVRQAILRLKPERQQVIILRFIEGFSIGEVAAILGKTDNNVRVIQHRALADLRVLLAQPAPSGAAGDMLLGALRQAVAGAMQRWTGARGPSV